MAARVPSCRLIPRPQALCAFRNTQTGVLGEGTFGVVVRACDPTSSSGEIAIKLLPRGDFVSLP